jgi:hypothetical protein
MSVVPEVRSSVLGEESRYLCCVRIDLLSHVKVMGEEEGSFVQGKLGYAVRSAPCSCRGKAFHCAILGTP